MASIGELFIALGFKVDDSKLKSFDGGVKTLGKNLIKVPVIAAAAAFAIDRFAASAFNAAVALQNFNNQTGLLESKLRQFQVAGQLSDISLSADQVTASVSNLQKNLTDISLGGGNISPFQMLGVSVVGKDAFQVIEDIRENIKGLSPALATSLISQTGLDPKFINILRLSNEEFAKLGNQYILSDKANKDLVDLGTAFTNLKLALTFFKNQVVVLISKPLIGLAKSIQKMTGNLTKGVIAFRKMTGSSKPLARALQFLTLLFTGMAVAMFPVTATLAGLLLLLEDFAVFAQGGDSAIGFLLDKLKEIPDTLMGMFKSIRDFILNDIIKPVDEIINKIPFIGGNNGGEDGEGNRGLIESYFDNIGTTFDVITEGFSRGVFGSESVGSPITQYNTFNISAETIDSGVNAANRLQNQSSVALGQLNNGNVN